MEMLYPEIVLILSARLEEAVERSVNATVHTHTHTHTQTHTRRSSNGNRKKPQPPRFCSKLNASSRKLHYSGREKEMKGWNHTGKRESRKSPSWDR